MENRQNLNVSSFLRYVVLILGAGIMLLPFLWMLSTAFKNSDVVFVFPPQFIPKEITFENFKAVKEAFPVFKFFFNSSFVAITTTLGQLLISSMAAYAFARIEFRGREVLFLIYLGTLMVPSQVTLTPLFILMKYLGWANSYKALIFPKIFTAFGTFLMRQAFLGIPKSLEEAAFIDGAGHFRVFWKIILPLTKPSLATLAILSFMDSWNNFLWPLIITSDISKMTLPLGLASLQGRWETDWNVLMAGTLINILPMLIVYLIAQKHIIKGLSHTGIK
ncbi:carbohydrate ABC transporter permease [Clostridium sediminicola]|uniref:carbohydrate ABC transporter permease n=1 Tax=Clostridium sediminicola TaxID=3114879 RepID=UPI0031F21EF1